MAWKVELLIAKKKKKDITEIVLILIICFTDNIKNTS